jgi:hypothetical protein
MRCAWSYATANSTSHPGSSPVSRRVGECLQVKLIEEILLGDRVYNLFGESFKLTQPQFLLTSSQF